LASDCGLSYTSGAVDVLGAWNFMWPQTALMILGVAVGSFFVALAAFPSRPHIAAALGVLVPTLVVLLQSPTDYPRFGE
jgi:hypothetical protein